MLYQQGCLRQRSNASCIVGGHTRGSRLSFAA
jgi:hypothetical protein